MRDKDYRRNISCFTYCSATSIAYATTVCSPAPPAYQSRTLARTPGCCRGVRALETTPRTAWCGGGEPGARPMTRLRSAASLQPLPSVAGNGPTAFMRTTASQPRRDEPPADREQSAKEQRSGCPHSPPRSPAAVVLSLTSAAVRNSPRADSTYSGSYPAASK